MQRIILKTTRGKQHITYKGIHIMLSGDFSAEILHTKKEWHDIFKEMKDKNLQPIKFYPAANLI